MRTHAEMIRDAGGWRDVAGALGFKGDAARAKVKFWERRDSIPCDYWIAFVKISDATVDELALHAHRRRYLKERRKLAA